MRVIVTAGPTYEPLDAVRRLTNFSTGRLGSELVNFLSECGHEVTLLIGQQATWRGERHARRVETFSTTADLRQRLQSFAREPVDAICHAAAVSDFSFGKVWSRQEDGELQEIRSGKFSTRAGVLVAELVPTPKVISELRGWYPAARIVGWKYEVEGDRSSVLRLARRQIEQDRTDACVANGPAYGAGFGLVSPAGAEVHASSAADLFRALEQFLTTGKGSEAVKP